MRDEIKNELSATLSGCFTSLVTVLYLVSVHNQLNSTENYLNFVF